jgi:hypothetical protein
MAKRKDLTGMKFGKLTAIRPTKRVLNRIRVIEGEEHKEYEQEYECLCECGNLKISRHKVLVSVLAGKGTGSCGCAHRKDSGGGDWSVSFNMVWKNYVCHAASNNREFKLTKEQFNELISNDCHYCGSEPSAIMKSKSKKKPNQTIYNGVDRVDNDCGYILANCVSCCEICNKMKLMLTQQEFLAHITKIHQYSLVLINK